MCGGIWFLGCVMFVSVMFLARIYHQGSFSDIRQADVIIVLGAAQWNGEPSPVFQARLDHAHELYVQRHAALILLTGGRAAETTASDSSVGKTYLMWRGTPADQILNEDQSRTTLQNLTLAREMMQPLSLRSALLVTHDFHMMRARRMARDLNMNVFPVPVSTKSSSIKLWYAAREMAVYAAYVLLGI